MPRNKNQVTAALGVIQSLLTQIMSLLNGWTGSDETFYKLATPEGKNVLKQMCKLASQSPMSPMFEIEACKVFLGHAHLLSNRSLPQFSLTNESYVGDNIDPKFRALIQSINFYDGENTKIYLLRLAEGVEAKIEKVREELGRLGLRFAEAHHAAAFGIGHRANIAEKGKVLFLGSVVPTQPMQCVGLERSGTGGICFLADCSIERLQDGRIAAVTKDSL